MSLNPNDSGHYTECPLHEDYIQLAHQDNCDKVIDCWNFCSCGADDYDNECICADIKSSRDYDNACEKGGV